MVAGVIALRNSGYTRVFLALLIIAIISRLLVRFTLPETAANVVGNGMKPVRGFWRTWPSFFSGRNQSYHSKSSAVNADAEADASESQLQKDGRIVWRPLSVFVSLRLILYLDAAIVLSVIASSYSVYYTFQVAILPIIDKIYGFYALEVGLAFIPGLVGMTIEGFIVGKLMDRNHGKTAREYNVNVDWRKEADLRGFSIENARYQHCLPFLSLEVVLMLGYSWVVHSHVHPSVPLIIQFSCVQSRQC